MRKLFAVGTAVLLSLLASQTAAQQCLYELISPNQEYGGCFGGAVSSAGDVNNDGYADVIVGATNLDASLAAGEGCAHIFSGLTGACLYSFESPNDPDSYFGNSVAAAGDFEGDGYDDVIVGSWYDNTPHGIEDAGLAYIFSGRTGDLLKTLVSPDPQVEGYFGTSVAAAGDVDGDGRTDVIIGAPMEDRGTRLPDAGKAYLFSGFKVASPPITLRSPHGEPHGGFGWSVAALGDVDGDGHDDFLVGAPNEDPGTLPEHAGMAYVFSGATHEVLHELVSPNPEYHGNFGVAVAGILTSTGMNTLILLSGLTTKVAPTTKVPVWLMSTAGTQGSCFIASHPTILSTSGILESRYAALEM